MGYQVYILYSAQIDKYYVGHTSNSLPDCLRRHLSNHKGFTAMAKDWVICYSEVFESKSTAYRREREIKSMKSRDYIESLIRERG
ncbi:MAG: GIY-YIG nuclease family protein [Flavobacteriaceae bacterium]|nr:GIY-YIG nuclease family protein [Flavobacteriaceae bacterium]